MKRPELFDLVGLGGTALTRARFRVRVLPTPPRLRPGSLLLVTHRSDWDVLLTTNIYWPERMWRRDPRLVFVARDDMFLPGFVAGYPGGLPRPLRRALAGVDVGRVLRAQRLALPIASASRAQLAHVARQEPSLPIDALGDDLVAAVRERARRLRHAEPRTAGELLAGAYVDLLWPRWRDRSELPDLEEFWNHRRTAARRDFEALVEHIGSGGSLVIYPEGHPSPGGAIGPLEAGLRLLVRRARPSCLIPIGLAYDPLCRGRTRAYLAIGEPFAPADDDVEGTALAALRQAMPVTPGAVAAHALAAGLDPREVAEAALADGRPREPRLRELLPETLEAARVAPRRVLERLDLEHRSASGL